MEKEEMDKLGFTEQASWENEDAEKKALFDKIHNLKVKAQETFNLRAEYLKSKEKPTES